tara:strand:- start:26 stop:538 length:513 start_codon:yes stop_codon:yes gene_type:complete
MANGISENLIVNDIGNAQLHNKHKVQLTQIDNTKLARALVTDQHIIDKLFSIKKLDARQHKACDKYLFVINQSGAFATGSSCWGDYISSGNNQSKTIPRAVILIKVQRTIKKNVGTEKEKKFWKIMVENPESITKKCLSTVIECSEALINHYWYDQEPLSFFQQVLSDPQ